MKTAYILSLTASATALLISGCSSPATPQPGEPAPVTQTVPVQNTAQPVPYNGVTAPTNNQQLYGTSGAVGLPPQQQAAQIIDGFKATYEKLNKPRFVIYVNRELLGKAPTTTTSTPASSGQGTVITTNNLADKQTTRDIERITARPFRYAGATLADQPTATSLASADIKSPEAREALKKVADIAIEVLVSSRNSTVPQVSGQNLSVSVPDIQMTAIRLSDAAIIGQATAAEIVNQLPSSALSNLNIQDVLEATSLNLMSDITATAK